MENRILPEPPVERGIPENFLKFPCKYHISKVDTDSQRNLPKDVFAVRENAYNHGSPLKRVG
jgi:hypothetical protein